ncbi:hypothetical protein IGI04_029830 [Brassica rapa subsp. trilocularis]|uniref:Uncharacterized protein n=1 Tax=Brassica rapa subsp. trilocularis TaxID=1813537 RepID=A0ABQ7LS64_BRACM|nr:hypothetical protein IGI04_029830 [Brassica rapa subsp. trilocularis]
MEEDSIRILEDFMEVVWKTSLKSALYFRRLPRRLPISLPKSDPDLRNMYIKLRSEKHAYHIKKTSVMKGRHGRRLCQKTSCKSSGRLPVSRLEDFLEVVWKSSSL